MKWAMDVNEQFTEEKNKWLVKRKNSSQTIAK